MLEEIHERSHEKAQSRVDRFIQMKEKEKNLKLEKIRMQAARGNAQWNLILYLK